MTRALSLWLLLLPAVLVPFARGGVPSEARVLFAACAGLSLWLSWRATRGEVRAEGGAPEPRAIVLLPLALGLCSLAQCVPLPADLLRLLAPRSVALRSLPPLPALRWVPVSLDVWATLESVAFSFGLAAAAASALLLSRGRRARRLLAAVPVAAALLQLGVAGAKLAAPLPERLGFVNRNHLAALLVLGALTALGGALGRRGRSRRISWAVVSSLLGCCALLTLSRGAAVGLVLGAFALTLSRREEPGAGARPALVVALVLGVSLAFAFLAEGLLVRWLSLGPERLAANLSGRAFVGAVAVVRDHWLLGVGRGAYRFVSDQHNLAPGDVTFVYAENEPLQLFAELGVPLGLLLLWLAARAVWEARASAELGPARGAWAGALALAVHAQVDFNLELLGVALPLVLALAAAAGAARGPAEARRGDGRSHGPGERWLPLGLAGLALAAALASVFAEARSSERAAQRLLALANDRTVGAQPLLAAAAVEAARHPVDWLVSLAPAVGLHARSPARTGLALAWAGRAQALAPGAWRPRYVTAEILLRAGARAQAREELRAALERLPQAPPGDLLDLTLRAATGVEELESASPEAPLVRLALVVRLAMRGRPAEAEALAAAELSRLPAGHGARGALLAQRAHALLALGNPGAARAVAGTATGDAVCLASVIGAQARAQQGEGPQAIEATLAQAAGRCPKDRDLVLLWARTRLGRGDAQGTLALLADPRFSPESTPWESDGRLLRAEALEKLGAWMRARGERLLAAQLSPERADLALDLAQRLLAEGDRAGALSTLRLLLGGARGEAKDRIAARLTELERR